jgi:hypothetical protein
MGIVVSKKRYTSVPTDDGIKVKSISYKDGVPSIPYKDDPYSDGTVYPAPQENRYAVAGDVV